MFKSNAPSFNKAILSVSPKWEKRVAQRIVAVARFAHKSLIDKTPVWEGRAVRNYIMTVGRPFTGVYEPIANGPTGQTSKMSLGVEPRRGPNEEAALATGSSLTLKNSYSRIFISNNSPDIGGLERGELPGTTPSRSSNGMFGITLEEAIQRLNAKAL
jgi:hypothetical protein